MFNRPSPAGSGRQDPTESRVQRAGAGSSETPDGDLDVQDAALVIDRFRQAADANLRSRHRKGAIVNLPARGRLLMTGDLHDNGLNFHRILKLAALHESPDRFLILHEVVHGPGCINGRDLSVRMLARVAALKVAYPDQVLLLQSNHELAQLTGESILKNSASVVEAYDAGLDFLYADDADEVRGAMNRFIRSLLLGVQCANGVFCCHSLPSPRKLGQFDKTVIDRVPTDDDLGSDGPAYQMVWGRNHNQKVADELAGAWGAKLFVVGHQTAETGYETEGESILIIASNHDHGVVLPIDLDANYDLDGLIGQIVPLAAVVL